MELNYDSILKQRQQQRQQQQLQSTTTTSSTYNNNELITINNININQRQPTTTYRLRYPALIDSILL